MWLDPRPADLFQRGMRCDRHATLISHIESREDHIQVSLSSNSSARTFFAPGRVNLIGEHTGYNGGFAMPAAESINPALATGRLQAWLGMPVRVFAHKGDDLTNNLVLNGFFSEGNSGRSPLR